MFLFFIKNIFNYYFIILENFFYIYVWIYMYKRSIFFYFKDINI